MSAKTIRNSLGRAGAITFVVIVTCAALLACGQEALAQLLPPPPLPPVLPLPQLPQVNLTSPALVLAPPALPTIPSLPQVLPSNAPATSGSTQLPATGATVNAKLLIISADGSEPVLGSIRQAADYEGIPYTLYVATKTPGGFTPDLLSDGGGHAYYQGIVLTTGSLAYFNGTAWTSAFTSPEWQALWDYQAKYRIRTVIAYAYPTADLGYGPATGVDATTTPISAQLTSDGQSVFPYVNAANPIVITKAWTYLAAAQGTGTTVLLGDSQGHALSLIRAYPDGRQVLSMTFDGNFFLVHSLALSYGVLNWVTGGLFLGERHVYMSPQIDDVFIDDDVYGGGTYRITGADWTADDAWQANKRLASLTADLHLHLAFNGEGTTGTYPLDTLTPAARLTSSDFPWINHTFTHLNLDAATYDQTYQEITENNQTATSMGFANYDNRTMVTPDISGLSNPDAMSAAYDAGIRYLVTDTSQPGMDNPTPQAGIANSLVPDILMIPRRPVNLYYNVTTPTEWTGEYNSFYHNYWGRDLSYTEILDKESDVLLQYMLRGEIDPWMFHQSNMRAYDGVHSLLGDLLDRTLDKYSRLFVLPVRSPTLAAIGDWTSQRMTYNTAGVQCSFVPDQGTITITASNDVVVPVTGLQAGTSEVYGGQYISHIALSAGQSVTYNVASGAARMQTGVSATATPAPATWSLAQNSPNPFNPMTRIRFDVPRPSRVDLRVFDSAGRLVRTLVKGNTSAGVHVVTWDGHDEQGASVASGIYFYELRAGRYIERRRMVLLK